jgi:hypothetical protein
LLSRNGGKAGTPVRCEQDGSLKRFYTEVSPDDIVKKRSILAAVTSDDLADNAPLW